MPTRHLFQQEQAALGSRIILTLCSSEPEAVVNPIFYQLWITILEFEKRCSRFLQNSELSNINAHAGLKTAISEPMHQVLHEAQTMAKHTNGLFNPFVLPALQRAGYTSSMYQNHSTDAQLDVSDRAVVAANKLKLSKTHVQLPYGTALDLGGIGKGYIGDQLAALVESFPSVKGFWFSLGGDVVCGGSNEHNQPWEVHVQALSPDGTYCLRHITQPRKNKRFAAATSATNVRAGTHKNKAWHHIIDPRTNLPATTDITLATVCAESLQEADVLASCAIILGSAQAPGFCLQRHATHVLLASHEFKVLFESDGFSVHPK